MGGEREKERSAAVAYIRSLLLAEPIGEAEEHVNDVVAALATDIERGVHRIYARGEL